MDLLVCPTPIGNLEDVTPRQLDALRSADIIACEDTRKTGKLLELLGIERQDGKPRLVSYHDHNARERAPKLVRQMKEGEGVVLVSDAGTPVISDPGYRLVRAAREAGLNVSALPGPAAAVVGLSASGLPSDRFLFEGFLTTKRKVRRERLEALGCLRASVIVYETGNRLVELLNDVDRFVGDVDVYVGRELTKVHEEHLWGRVSEVVGKLSERDEIKGEVVVVFDPTSVASRQPDIVRAEADVLIRSLLDEEIHPASIKSVVSTFSGLSKSDVFDRMERLKDKDSGS